MGTQQVTLGQAASEAYAAARASKALRANKSDYCILRILGRNCLYRAYYHRESGAYVAEANANNGNCFISA